MPTTAIDAAWLANATHGASASGWALATPGSYQLQADLAAARTALAIGGGAFDLDLASHSIACNGDAAPGPIPNQDFAADAIGSATVTGWTVTLSGTATQQVVDATPWRFRSRFASQSLKITWNPDAGDPNPVIKSGPIPIDYGASGGLCTFAVAILASALDTVHGTPPNRGCSCRVEVYEDAACTVAPPVYRSVGASADVGQGSGGWFKFRPSSTAITAVYAKITLVPGDGSGAITCALARARITRSDVPAILATGINADATNGYDTNVSTSGQAGYAAPICNLNAAQFSAWQGAAGVGALHIWDSTAPRATYSGTISAITGQPPTLAGGSLQAGTGHVTITNAGSGLDPLNPPRVWFSYPAAHGARVATGTAVVNGSGQLTDINITDGGLGYRFHADDAATVPTITIEPPGKIIVPRGMWGPGIFAQGHAGDLTVEDVHFVLQGDDQEGIDASLGGSTGTRTFRNCVFEFTGCGPVSIRSLLFPVINTVDAGTTLVESCVILDNPLMGLKIGSTLAGAGAIIRFNSLFPDEVHTNGYSIYQTGNNIDVHHNAIVAGPTKGARGVEFQQVTGGTTYTGISFHHNFIDLYEQPNREYGSSVGARGLAFRNISATGAVKNVSVYENSVTVHASPTTQLGCYAMRVSFDGDWTAQQNANFSIHDNWFTAILETAGTGSFAYALMLDQADPGVGFAFARNVWESTNTSMQFGGPNRSGGHGVYDVSFTDDVVRKYPAGAAGQTYVPRAIGMAGTGEAMDRVSFWAMSYIAPATPTITWADAGTKTIDEGWTASVHCQDGAGSPVAGATITLTDSAATTVHAGTSDSAGTDGPFGVSTTRHRQATTDPTAITTTTLTPHTLTATASGLAAPAAQAFTLAADATKTLVFGGTTPIPTPGTRTLALATVAGTFAWSY